MDDSQDAARYRWLRDRKKLTLLSAPMKWRREDGTEFVSTHYLAADDTQYASQETLDATIDVAMQR